MGLTELAIYIVKIIGVLAWVYGLLWVLGRQPWPVKIVGLVVAWAIPQAALTSIGGVQVLNGFDNGLLLDASAIAMLCLGLNLIYGFNGQFSLGQYGFYGIGAYTAADITYKWVNGDASGLFVGAIGVIVGAAMILGLKNFLVNRFKGMPVMSQLTLYLIGAVVSGVIAWWLGNILAGALAPAFGTQAQPSALVGLPAQNVVLLFAVLIGGAFAAEVSFLFGLPVLTLGSDYFGIATLGFTIVIQTLMVNSDTLLPFPEMKGGRGMIGIPKLTTWTWAFVFLVAIIVVMRNLIYSSTGRAMLSVREDETAAKAMGIDVANYKLLAFVIGSLFAGVAGGIYAHYIGFLSPATFSFIAGFNPLIIVVFGGLGSMTGTLMASFGWMFFLEGLLRVLLGQLGTDAPTWRYVLYPIALLLLMLLRPQGLLGTTEWGFLKAPKAALDITEGPQAVTAAPAK